MKSKEDLLDIYWDHSTIGKESQWSVIIEVLIDIRNILQGFFVCYSLHEPTDFSASEISVVEKSLRPLCK